MQFPAIHFLLKFQDPREHSGCTSSRLRLKNENQDSRFIRNLGYFSWTENSPRVCEKLMPMCSGAS